MSQVDGRKRNVFHLSASKRPVGFGAMIDFIPPITVREKDFEIEVNLIWFRFWWVRFKKQ